jgi:uncharacterized protein (TIGR02246 family)
MAMESKMAVSRAQSIEEQSLRTKLRLCLSRKAKERKQKMENNQSIYELVRVLEDAWNSSNSQGFASVFAEDADFITVLGKHYNGRGPIDAGHRAIFDTIYKRSHNRYTIEGVRFIRPDVVVVFVCALLELADGRTISARPSMLLTKENGKWQVAMLQNTVVAAENVSPLEMARAGA